MGEQQDTERLRQYRFAVVGALHLVVGAPHGGDLVQDVIEEIDRRLGEQQGDDSLPVDNVLMHNETYREAVLDDSREPDGWERRWRGLVASALKMQQNPCDVAVSTSGTDLLRKLDEIEKLYPVGSPPPQQAPGVELLLARLRWLARAPDELSVPSMRKAVQRTLEQYESGAPQQAEPGWTPSDERWAALKRHLKEMGGWRADTVLTVMVGMEEGASE